MEHPTLDPRTGAAIRSPNQTTPSELDGVVFYWILVKYNETLQNMNRLLRKNVLLLKLIIMEISGKILHGGESRGALIYTQSLLKK